MKPSGKTAQDGDIYKLNFDYQEDEMNFIVDRINSLIGTEWIDNNGRVRGLAHSDIAIFFRSVRYESKPYLEALKKLKFFTLYLVWWIV
jgi:superfamily I DNA/RNA helicase